MIGQDLDLGKKVFCVIFALFLTGFIAAGLNKIFGFCTCSEAQTYGLITLVLICSLFAVIVAGVLIKKLTP